MVTLQENVVKFNNHLIVSHDGGVEKSNICDTAFDKIDGAKGANHPTYF